MALLNGSAPFNSGDLNYVLTKALDRFIEDQGLSYSSINTAVGALECAKLELYRRVAVPYEDIKLSLNGDVYSRHNGNPHP